jgi:hypothetical protein
MTRNRLIQVVAVLAVVTVFVAAKLSREIDCRDNSDVQVPMLAPTALDLSLPNAGLLDYWTMPVAAGPVHPDWPIFVAAEIPGPFGWAAHQDSAAKARADEFAAPPVFEPPNRRQPEQGRHQGFFVAGPPGPVDDRFEVAEVAWSGRDVTVTVEGWRSRRPAATKDLRRPTHVVQIVPQLPPGEYDLTVVWRDFWPAEDRTLFWYLASVLTATTKLTVYPDAPPPGEKAVGLKATDFRQVRIAPAEAARRWLPVPAVRRVRGGNGFQGFLGPGVTAGTFDPLTWEKNLYTAPERVDAPDGGIWAPNKPPPVRPASRGAPLYAVVYSPVEVNMDQCRVRAIEWTRNGYLIHVQFFHTGFVTGSNTFHRSAYVVPLLHPPLTGQIPVTVRWSAYHGNHWREWKPIPFRRLGPGLGLPSGDWIAQPASPSVPRPGWMDHDSRCELTILP